MAFFMESAFRMESAFSFPASAFIILVTGLFVWADARKIHPDNKISVNSFFIFLNSLMFKPICQFDANGLENNINACKANSCWNIKIYLRAKHYQIGSLELPQWEGKRITWFFSKPKIGKL